jgi:hypothetical protein
MGLTKQSTKEPEDLELAQYAFKALLTQSMNTPGFCDKAGGSKSHLETRYPSQLNERWVN